jgi:hypothetical protein
LDNSCREIWNMRPFFFLISSILLRTCELLLFYRQTRIVVDVERRKSVLKVGAALEDTCSTGKRQMTFRWRYSTSSTFSRSSRISFSARPSAYSPAPRVLRSFL